MKIVRGMEKFRFQTRRDSIHFGYKRGGRRGVRQRDIERGNERELEREKAQQKLDVVTQVMNFL